jgi:hypothetical protein
MESRLYFTGMVPMIDLTSFDVGRASQEQPSGPPVMAKFVGHFWFFATE